MDSLISRQAAIDALARAAREKFNLSDEFNHYLAWLMDGENAIRQLPSAQPQWIPVTERLPEEDVEVLVYLFDPPSPYIAWVSKFDGKWCTEDFTLDEEDNPIAWMPLPESYKGGQE